MAASASFERRCIDVTSGERFSIRDAFSIQDSTPCRMMRPRLSQVLLRRFDGGAKGDRIGDVGQCYGIDAGAFDAQMPITQKPAPERLIDANALNVLQCNLIRGKGEEPGLLHETMGGHRNLRRPFADHHGEENDDADDDDTEEQQRQHGLQRVPPVEPGLRHDHLARAEGLLDVTHCDLLPRIYRGGRLERAKGIEPSYAAWEAAVLPLNYARDTKTWLFFWLFFIPQRESSGQLGRDPSCDEIPIGQAGARLRAIWNAPNLRLAGAIPRT